ncbi:tyrosine-type recombinase/integrase [Spirochaetota bacterium]
MTNKYVELLKLELKSRNYSTKTIYSYLHYNKAFIKFAVKDLLNVQPIDVKRYLSYLINIRHFSVSTINIVISALNFMYTNILKKDFLFEVKRPKKEKRIPVVFSKDEVYNIISCIKNLKHRAIIMMGYSAGLRVSEAVSIKIKDIDSKRGVIHIRQAKGGKDRRTLLSTKALDLLRQYYRKTRPELWLFPSPDSNDHLSTRSAEKIFKKALKKSHIQKEASFHTLRHSFATHLLESGVDLRYIQELLGHSSSKVTEIYTHVSNKNLVNIKNPLDSIYEEK